jgi:hypothetical protein
MSQFSSRFAFSDAFLGIVHAKQAESFTTLHEDGK